MGFPFSKTVAAIDGPVGARHERDFGRRPAVGADHGGQFTPGLLPGRTARLATLGFVYEPFLGIKRLLACGKDKLLTAVPTP